MRNDGEEEFSLGAAVVVLLIIAGFFIYKSDFWSRSSPEVVSVGVVRLVSCEHKGSFLGGVGYDCVARNFENMPIKVAGLVCASYDSSERMLGQPNQVYDMRESAFGSGGEKVVRFYHHEDARRVVCLQNEDEIPGLERLNKIITESAARGWVTKVKMS